MVDDVLKDIPIDVNSKIFELGCGTGAVLKRIKQKYGSDVIIGGSDLSYNAIEVARKTFPEENNHFFVISMTDNRQLLVSKITTLRTFPILMCAGMDPGQYFSFFCPYSHIIISLYA